VGPPWWDIAFLPLHDADGLLGIVGRIRVVGQETPVVVQPLPEPIFALRHRLTERFGWELLASEQPLGCRVQEQARLASTHRLPVSLIGERGTGKRTLARVVHHQGVTAEQPFLAIDSAALSESVQEELLFGNLALGKTSRAGTVFLRDISRMPKNLQARLAEWFAERSVSGPRVVASFNCDPASVVAAGFLREDLYLPLSVQTITLVPLRERLGDLPRWASGMLERCQHAGLPACPGWDGETLEFLTQYSWPGNLRELDSAMYEAARNANGHRLSAQNLPDAIRREVSRNRVMAASPTPAAPRKLTLDQILEQIERRMILMALRKCKGNKSEAADLLGIWRARLLRRLEALKIDDDDWRKE
jgi:DNA-binding NtrC family response regulator